MRLTAAIAADIIGTADPTSATKLVASKLQIDHVDDLSAFTQLRRLDLSTNSLTGGEDLKAIGRNTDIAWISVAHNRISKLNFVSGFTALQVLNASHNEIHSLQGMELNPSIKALVLNNNRIKTIEGLGRLPNLNSLILSRNGIETITGLRHLKQLKKLSLGHNAIRAIPSELSANIAIEELRLNDNLISTIPDSIVSLSKTKLIELGNNRISKLDGLQALGLLPNLINLNLRGNPVCRLAEYKDTVRALCPSLRVFDGVNITPMGHPVAKRKRREAAKKRKHSDERVDVKKRKETPQQSTPPMKKRKEHQHESPRMIERKVGPQPKPEEKKKRRPIQAFESGVRSLEQVQSPALTQVKDFKEEEEKWADPW